MSMPEEEYARDEFESEEGREAELQEAYEAGIEDTFEKLPEEDTESEPVPTMEKLHPRDILHFANNILMGIVIIFILGCISMLLWPDRGGTKIFEFCSRTLPPIVTLILGSYFSAGNKS
jgi:hypothetical protein